MAARASERAIIYLFFLVTKENVLRSFRNSYRDRLFHLIHRLYSPKDNVIFSLAYLPDHIEGGGRSVDMAGVVPRINH